jgi:hypothetical protein
LNGELHEDLYAELYNKVLPQALPALRHWSLAELVAHWGGGKAAAPELVRLQLYTTAHNVMLPVAASFISRAAVQVVVRGRVTADEALRVGVRFGRTVVSQAEAPNLFANLV